MIRTMSHVNDKTPSKIITILEKHIYRMQGVIFQIFSYFSKVLSLYIDISFSRYRIYQRS